jgi:hypothetical protein
MKRTQLLFAAGLASILAAIGPDITSAASGTMRWQDLATVKGAGQAGGRWMRYPECYGLHLWISKPIATMEQQDDGRGRYFIEHPEIANLRGFDPTSSFCTGIGSEGRVPPSAFRNPRVEAWLLKGDGTQIQAVDYKGGLSEDNVSVRYRYWLEDGIGAIAVAIRIDDKFYIEKLQPLGP